MICFQKSIFALLIFLMETVLASNIFEIIETEKNLCSYFASKNITSALVVAAHPDDIETSAGGTVMTMALNCSISVFYVLTTSVKNTKVRRLKEKLQEAIFDHPN